MSTGVPRANLTRDHKTLLAVIAGRIRSLSQCWTSSAGHRDRLLRGGSGLCVRLRSALNGHYHDLRLCPRILVTVGLLIYLTYALLRPERF